MRIEIGDLKINDHSATKLLSSEINICQFVNIAQNDPLNASTVKLFDRNAVMNLIGGKYRFKTARVYDDSVLIFTGKVAEASLSGNKINLTLKSELQYAMESYFDYEVLSENPVLTVKNLLESAGASTDSESYSDVAALFDGVVAGFTYAREDEVSYEDAISNICELFDFYVYSKLGKFYFWAEEIFSETKSIKRFWDAEISFKDPEFTSLSVVYGGGESAPDSCFDLDGDDDLIELYGTNLSSFHVDRGSPIFIDDLEDVTSVFTRKMELRGKSRPELEFNSKKKYEFNCRYLFIYKETSFFIRLIRREKKDGYFEYKAVKI